MSQFILPSPLDIDHFPRSLLHDTMSLLFFSRGNFWFLMLIFARYLRLVVHMYAYHFIYSPTPIPPHPSFQRSDVSVIIPTIDPDNEDFAECLNKVLLNRPGQIIIVTVGSSNLRILNDIVQPLRLMAADTDFMTMTSKIASKRLQVAQGLRHVTRSITILLDDHVFWPSTDFLPTVLAPFENPSIGSVGTNKVVRRTSHTGIWRSYWNFLGCTYLERHNFEITATNAIDGGIFCLSGRTSAHRSKILQDGAFIDGFCNEFFFFNKFGPLNADDDNFITRWLVRNDWGIKIQHCPDATIETTLGTPGKFLSQCLRKQPWCAYAIHLTSFVNFALFFDVVIVYYLYHGTTFGNSRTAVGIMVTVIMLSKLVKLLPHFRRHPRDLLFFPGYVLFAYYHSLIKLWAMFTFWNVAWGGRNLAAVNNDMENSDPAPIEAQDAPYEASNARPRPLAAGTHGSQDISTSASASGVDDLDCGSSTSVSTQPPGFSSNYNIVPFAPFSDYRRSHLTNSKSSHQPQFQLEGVFYQSANARRTFVPLRAQQSNLAAERYTHATMMRSSKPYTFRNTSPWREPAAQAPQRLPCHRNQATYYFAPKGQTIKEGLPKIIHEEVPAPPKSPVIPPLEVKPSVGPFSFDVVANSKTRNMSLGGPMHLRYSPPQNPPANVLEELQSKSSPVTLGSHKITPVPALSTLWAQATQRSIPTQPSPGLNPSASTFKPSVPTRASRGANALSVNARPHRLTADQKNFESTPQLSVDAFLDTIPLQQAPVPLVSAPQTADLELPANFSFKPKAPQNHISPNPSPGQPCPPHVEDDVQDDESPLSSIGSTPPSSSPYPIPASMLR